MTSHGRGGREERRAYWESAVELHRSSGLGVREFCEREGLSPASFYAWRRKLEQNQTGQNQTGGAAAAFMPLRVMSVEAPLVIELGRATLRVGERCSGQLLATAIEALGC